MLVLRNSHLSITALVLILLLLPACGRRENASPTQQSLDPNLKAKSGALVREWFDLAKSPKDNMNNPRCRQIAIELLEIGPEQLKPLFEVIADPGSTIEVKVLAVASLDSVVIPGVLTWLTTLVSPEMAADTRACAVQLLAVSGDPSVIPTLRACANDPDKRVRLAAQVGLMAQGDPEARKSLAGQLQAEGTGRNERARILTSFVSDPRAEDLPLLLSAMKDSSFSFDLRVQAISVVGRLGDESALKALEQLKETEQNEELRALAKDAIEAIRSRQKTP